MTDDASGAMNDLIRRVLRDAPEPEPPKRRTEHHRKEPMSDNQEQPIDARIAQVLRDNGHDDIAAALEAKSGSPTEEPAAERSEGEGVAQELRAVLDRGVTTIPDFLK